MVVNRGGKLGGKGMKDSGDARNGKYTRRTCFMPFNPGCHCWKGKRKYQQKFTATSQSIFAFRTYQPEFSLAFFIGLIVLGYNYTFNYLQYKFLLLTIVMLLTWFIVFLMLQFLISLIDHKVVRTYSLNQLTGKFYLLSLTFNLFRQDKDSNPLTNRM